MGLRTFGRGSQWFARKELVGRLHVRANSALQFDVRAKTNNNRSVVGDRRVVDRLQIQGEVKPRSDRCVVVDFKSLDILHLNSGQRIHKVFKVVAKPGAK